MNLTRVQGMTCPHDHLPDAEDGWFAAADGDSAVVPWSAVQTRPCTNICYQGMDGERWIGPAGIVCDCDDGQVPSWVFYCEDDEWLRERLEMIPWEDDYTKWADVVLRLLRGEGE